MAGTRSTQPPRLHRPQSTARGAAAQRRSGRARRSVEGASGAMHGLVHGGVGLAGGGAAGRPAQARRPETLAGARTNVPPLPGRPHASHLVAACCCTVPRPQEQRPPGRPTPWSATTQPTDARRRASEVTQAGGVTQHSRRLQDQSARASSVARTARLRQDSALSSTTRRLTTHLGGIAPRDRARATRLQLEDATRVRGDAALELTGRHGSRTS